MSIHLLASFVATVGLCLLAGNLHGDEQRTGPESVAEDLTPDVGKVFAATQIVGKAVQDNTGTIIGEVSDVVVDPYCARIVSLVVSPSEKLDRIRGVLVPFEVIKSLAEKSLVVQVSTTTIEANATSLTEGESQPFTRRMSIATFRHYNIKPYWTDKAGNKVESSPVDRDDQFVMLSNLGNMAIHDLSGEELGRIADVVVSQDTGKIVYAIFAHTHRGESKDEQLMFPIPLAAFVVPPKTNKWSLQLPESLLDNTPTIKAGKLPDEVERGWVEYIHVRYGGGVFDGVQRTAKRSD